VNRLSSSSNGDVHGEAPCRKSLSWRAISLANRRTTHLGLVRCRDENIRANILFGRLNAKGRSRVRISAELPIVYATGRPAQGWKPSRCFVHCPFTATVSANCLKIKETVANSK
jgi:hypothetical protein